ncbi:MULTISPECIES: YbaB/EbfC family nucleoid-associated protein [unclassified Streptomyces]|uniref:YbaB/EbfC family nucleoid-associated protein n=1 Tax=unclassified Streptomyces TaxID=2593676 RepID=UPI00381FA69F
MSSRYDQEIEELLAQYRRQRDEAVETRRRINETTSTATAPRQAVKVTVGAQGQVTALEFPTGAYRRMPPKELADLLLTTIQQARAEALKKVDEIVSEQLPAGLSLSSMLQGQVDVKSFLPEEPLRPEAAFDAVIRNTRGESDG